MCLLHKKERKLVLLWKFAFIRIRKWYRVRLVIILYPQTFLIAIQLKHSTHEGRTEEDREVQPRAPSGVGRGGQLVAHYDAHLWGLLVAAQRAAAGHGGW